MMKIINLTQFRQLPEGVIFCKYHPNCFGVIQIKGETLNVDFISASLTGEIDCNDSDDFVNKLDKYSLSGESFNFDLDIYCRDGLYEDDMMFAIYEPSDILQLIDRLNKSLIITQINNI